MLRFVIVTAFMCVLAACGASVPGLAPSSSFAVAPPTINTTATPRIATPDPSRPTFSVSTISPSERQNVSSTWLYLTAFQSHNVSVIEPLSGHVLRELAVEGDQAGMAVAPDGTRLYTLDGGGDGELRVYDTATWQVIHHVPIKERALLLGGNPVELSGDGRWLAVAHLSYQTRQGWASLFDTQRMIFLPDDALPPRDCREGWLPLQLLGRPRHAGVYVHCYGFIAAFESETLNKLWQVTAPTAIRPAMVLTHDGGRLYGIYPRVNDLRLQVWQTADGRVSQKVLLGDRLSIPPATTGRGEGVYLALSPDDARLFIVWEDRLWALASVTLQVLGELHLPAPADGVAVSVDGGELYLLPSTAGDLTIRAHGMWVVDARTLTLSRTISDWPAWQQPFFYTAPANRQ